MTELVQELSNNNLQGISTPLTTSKWSGMQSRHSTLELRIHYSPKHYHKRMLQSCCCLVAQSYLTLCDPWTVARQAPPSKGFSRQEYWSGVPFPSPGDFLNPEIPRILLGRQILYQ